MRSKLIKSCEGRTMCNVRKKLKPSAFKGTVLVLQLRSLNHPAKFLHLPVTLTVVYLKQWTDENVELLH